MGKRVHVKMHRRCCWVDGRLKEQGWEVLRALGCRDNVLLANEYKMSAHRSACLNKRLHFTAHVGQLTVDRRHLYKDAPDTCVLHLRQLQTPVSRGT